MVTDINCKPEHPFKKHGQGGVISSVDIQDSVTGKKNPETLESSTFKT